MGSPESYPVVSGRYELLNLAREEGLRVPDTSSIHTLDDLKQCCSEKTLPVVLKADGTWGGDGVRIARTPMQAEQFYSELTRSPGAIQLAKDLAFNRDRFWLRHCWNAPKPKVVVQSYVPGRPANCAAACWQGRVIAGACVEVVTTHHANGPATVVRVVNNSQMMLCAERLARRLSLSGFFGLDFVIEDGSDAAYLIEMNPRATKLCQLQLGKGHDMIGALCSELSGQPLREAPPLIQNEMIAFFPQAWACENEFLRTSFPDIPLGEMELIRGLLGPSLERTILGSLLDWLRLSRLRQKEPTSTPLENCDEAPQAPPQAPKLGRKPEGATPNPLSVGKRRPVFENSAPNTLAAVSAPIPTARSAASHAVKSRNPGGIFPM